MKTKLTIEELEALLRFAFVSGQVSGKYMDVSPGNREKLKVKGFYHSFDDWYKAEVDETAVPEEKPAFFCGSGKEAERCKTQCDTCKNLNI